jgi:hypothetical protein
VSADLHQICQINLVLILLSPLLYMKFETNAELVNSLGSEKNVMYTTPYIAY